MNEQRNNGNRTADEESGTISQGTDPIRRPDLGEQLKGAAIGAVIGLGLGYLARDVLGLVQGRLVQYALWSAAIGGLIGGSDELAKAGSRLTKRDDKWLNVLVAVIGFIIILAVMVGIVSLAAWIVNTLIQPGL
jgi:hypothetical protein